MLQLVQVFHQDRSTCMKKMIKPNKIWSTWSTSDQLMVSPCGSQKKNPADFTSATGEATVAHPSHAGSDLLVREEIAIDRTDVIQLGASWKTVVWVSMAIH